MLHRALTDPPFRPLPYEAAALLVELDAPPRLAAHLRAVHDVAVELTDWLGGDRDLILFGAATHDIGKVVHPEELSAPGTRHEAAGHRLLLARGVEERKARFAGTHGDWHRPGIEFEDLVVSLADKIWKAKRVPDLEQLIVDRLAAAHAQEPWQAFMGLDDHLDRIAAGADARLAFQNTYPVAA
ncbi:HD domain-containing protein [Actinoplanes sp. NPDC049596]|uniref:HD domain-containing protein n=1 Tax=unclassified Actinoplanes TaxID=2626549 RepID=UPI0034182364